MQRLESQQLCLTVEAKEPRAEVSGQRRPEKTLGAGGVFSPTTAACLAPSGVCSDWRGRPVADVCGSGLHTQPRGFSVHTGLLISPVGKASKHSLSHGVRVGGTPLPTCLPLIPFC